MIALYINPSSLTLEPDGRSSKARLDILIGQKDTAGRIYAVPPYSVPLTVADSLLRSRGWLSTRATVALRAATTSIRIVVRDQGSGHIGSIDIPVRGLSS